MPAPLAQQNILEVPLKIVGGNQFGRYPKISVEQTFNMIISDEFLVDYAGYKNILTQSPASKGRGIYSSSRGHLMIIVLNSQVFRINISTDGVLSSVPIGNIATSSGDVFMAENNNHQIAITDLNVIYVYNWFTGATLAPASAVNPDLLAGHPGYISFQNGRLIVANTGTTNWYLSEINDANTWPNTSKFVGALQTKPDTVQAALPTPGGGNNLVLFGHTVIEQWQDIKGALFPYQRSSTLNVDYGCLNASSIAALDTSIVWLAANEQSGPTLMIMQGNAIKSISTDGMDFKFASLTNPENCTGFLFRQDGHLIYQFTFPDDNLSYSYDFSSEKFFTVTDENLDYHIARDVVFINNKYYFVSLKGGNLYEFGTKYTTLQYSDTDIQQIPRLRICPPLRLPSQRMFIGKSLGFTIENGQLNTITTVQATTTGESDTLGTEDLFDIATESGVLIATDSDAETIVTNTYTYASESVDLSISRDGGQSFGSGWRLDMNNTGNRKSRFIYQRLGQANDVTYQLRFNGFGRFVCTDGIVEIYT